MTNSYKRLFNILKKLKETERRDRETLYLTANESIMSPLAQKWLGSILASRYIFGSSKQRKRSDSYFYRKSFSVKGMPAFDELEIMAKNACRKMFHCQEVEFRALSGLHAMLSVVGSLTEPGDIIATLPPEFIGHFATRHLLKAMGRENIILPYNASKFELDLDAFKTISRKKNIRMFYLDTMHYFKPYPLKQIKKIVPDAILVYDGSHILGLIAGGQFQNPLREGADVLNGNTHKTLPGPQKGLIMYRDKGMAEKSQKIIEEAFVSSSHTSSTISLFITLIEMMNFGGAYAGQIIDNSRALAKSLVGKGFSVLGYPQILPSTHQILFTTENKNAGPSLIRAGIAVNSFPLFGKREIIRLGTQQVTRLGMKEKEMETIARLIKKVLKDNARSVKKEVKELCKSFHGMNYC